ncbi:TOBE domain-containing protein [Peribacillus psychrosaccharolyticus]|nr:TOBE domain-containing protein [Peribacillus psychrosaccharolyticus]MEC2055138.1 TOBE domain-containing protein [Peribacillus psychrosaccharolyticus]MED3746641.1 TOBE domain-containing protein [Peribacillus psychrosaccharolyticus]
MDVGGGNTIVSTITKKSVSTLGLKVGSEATAVIKATSVMLMA